MYHNFLLSLKILYTWELISEEDDIKFLSGLVMLCLLCYSSELVT